MYKNLTSQLNIHVIIIYLMLPCSKSTFYVGFKHGSIFFKIKRIIIFLLNIYVI